jgi:hypothetical protein
VQAVASLDEVTTSRRGQPAGGVWQGLNRCPGAVASAIWVNRPGWRQAIVFVDIDGESLADHRPLGRPRAPKPGPARREAPATKEES